MTKTFHPRSNLRKHVFRIALLKMNQHTGAKRSIYHVKPSKDSQLQIPKYPCRLFYRYDLENRTIKLFASIEHIVFVRYTPPKLVLGQLWPYCNDRYCDHFNETLSCSPYGLTSGVSSALKGMPRILNLNNWQRVWKYPIIHIRSFMNRLRCSNVSRKLVFFHWNSDSFEM